MLGHRQFVPWIAVMACSVSPATAGELTWRATKLETGALPADMPAPAQDAIRYWEAWADEHEYRMDLSADGRLLLLTLGDSRGTKRAKENMTRIERVMKRMDEILPLPASRAVEAAPQAPPAGADDGKFEYGRVARESVTAVLMEIDAPEHLVTAVDRIVAENEYLRAWGMAAGELTGFVLEQPLVAAWQPKAGIKEDWEGDSANEMVNRLAQLMTLRRFGRLPYWLNMGIAWQVEMEELEGVFCFPYRSGFVSSSEHHQWDRMLRNTFKGREGALRMSDITELKRGMFDMEAAQIGWGTVTFLVEHHPGALAEINDELYRLWDEKGRMTNPDGSWTRIVGFEPSDEDQLAVFEKHVPGFLTELQAAFLKGKSYKKP
jgi:hypothetical protein